MRDFALIQYVRDIVRKSVQEGRRLIPDMMRHRGRFLSVAVRGAGTVFGRVLGIERAAHGTGFRRQLMEQIGEEATKRLSENVRIISRTGSLASSFRHEIDGDDRLIIYSTVPYAHTIAEGRNWGRPPVENIEIWMGLAGVVPFPGQTYEQAATMIARAIATGAGRGATGRSVIYNLPPAGKFAYDYVTPAVQDATRAVHRVGDRVVLAMVKG